MRDVAYKNLITEKKQQTFPYAAIALCILTRLK